MPQIDQIELIKIFADVLKVDPRTLSDDSSPSNVEGWDSVKFMEIVVVLEEALNLEFSATEIGEMVSIGTIKKTMICRGVTIK